MTARQVADTKLNTAGLIKDRKRSLGLKEHALTIKVADASLGDVTTILGQRLLGSYEGFCCHQRNIGVSGGCSSDRNGRR